MHSVILYYVMQAWAAELHRQTQRDAPARAASRARRTSLPGPGGDHGKAPGAFAGPLAARLGR